MRLRSCIRFALATLLASASWCGAGAVARAQEECAGYYCQRLNAYDPPGGAPAGVTCEWTTDVTYTRQSVSVDGDFTERFIDTNRYRFQASTGDSWVFTNYRCSDGTGGSDWRLTNPDPAIFIPAAYDEAVLRIRYPVPALSPVYRGVVNLGMWLAVEPPEKDPVVERAQANDVWAEVTATLVGTTFDMGTGDEPIDCDGFGDPIPSWAKDDVAASPTCGYTYTDNDDAPYTITITSRWEFTYELSNGVIGTLDAVELSSSVDYNVIEIQTVGVSG
jgi:hypothetical protein